MKKFYELRDDYDKVHIIIQKHGYGKAYYEKNKYKRELENQQKEFIEYLTSYIDLLSNKPDLIEENQKDILEEILSKYKEIIGDDK